MGGHLISDWAKTQFATHAAPEDLAEGRARSSAERSWDCPLHGSRYSATGEVLEGPAVRSLDAPD